MTRQDARNEINSHPITYWGVTLRQKGKGYICPICGSGTGNNHSPGRATAGLSIRQSDNRVTCFANGCFNGQKGEDTLGALEKIWGLSETEVFERVGLSINGTKTTEKAPAPTPKKEPEQPRADFRDYISKAHAALMESTDAQTYLTGRGITPESWERFNLGYDAECYNKALGHKIPSIVIPYGRDGRYYITRPLTEKQYDKPTTREAGPEPIYNLKSLYYDKGAATVFVVESALCAISIMQESDAAAIALNGSAYNKLLEQITAQPTQKTLVLCLDNDDTGRPKQAELAGKLTAAGASFIEYNIAGEHKDPNDALQADRAAFADAVKKAIEAPEAEREKARQERAYQFKAKYSAAGRINAFMDDIAESVKNPPQPTGFTTLDGILDGGIRAGYAIVTGGTSIGKSAFCLQLADNVAAAGRDVLYFTLEMTAFDLMARSISRLTYENCGGREDNAKTARYITDGTKRGGYNPAEERLVAESIIQYADTIAPHLCFIEPRQIGNKDFLSTDDIRAVLEEYMTGAEPGAQGPLVIIDYAQLLRPSDKDKGVDAKQNMSNNATVLYHLSKQYNIPLIAITSLARSEYTQRDTMNAGKESGDLEYSAEYLFRLQFPAPPKVKKGNGERAKWVEQDYTATYEKEQKRKDPRTVELAIMKNRSGATGDTVTFTYHAKFNRFSEKSGPLDDVD